MKLKILIISVTVFLIFGLLSPMPDVNYDNSSISPFSNINYLLGTTKKGENFILIIYKGISTTLIIGIIASILTIILTITYHVLATLSGKNKKIINWIFLVLAEVSNLTPVLLIVIIVGAVTKINLGLLSIVISLTLFSISYRLTINSFDQFLNEPSTKFALKNNFNKIKIIKNYYFKTLKSNLISTSLILLIFAVGIEINIGYLRYGLDINTYYSFGRIVQENINYLGTTLSLGIIIPITLFTLFLYLSILYVTKLEKAND
jgi:peptide/nickel transport system permease protein